MVYVALAEAAALVVVVVTFAGLHRSQARAFARREDLILDKLLHSVGRTWTPPPADDRGWTIDDGNGDGPAYARFTTNPEQEV